MTTQSLTTTQAETKGHSHTPTARDLAHATPIVTLETVLVCTSTTALLTVVLGVIGLIAGLVITGLVLVGNAQVRQYSIENAIADRREGHDETHM